MKELIVSDGEYRDIDGYILTSHTEGEVRNAVFDIIDGRIIMYSGEWLSGTANNAVFRNGCTWHNGVLTSSSWMGGVWLDGAMIDCNRYNERPLSCFPLNKSMGFFSKEPCGGTNILYDKIKEQLRGIENGYEICGGCEFLHVGQNNVECKNRFYFSRFGVHGRIEWMKSEKAKPPPNCPRILHFKVFYNNRDFFESRDLSQCRQCKHFRDYRLSEEVIERRGSAGKRRCLLWVQQHGLELQLDCFWKT